MKKYEPFPSSKDDAKRARGVIDSPQTHSSAYRLAFMDEDFLLRKRLRPIRLQLELLKTEITLQEMGIESTVVVFGGTRFPDRETALLNLEAAEAKAKAHPDDKSLALALKKAERILANAKYYEQARELARIISKTGLPNIGKYVIITGGGPGIMEAANRGAHDVLAKNIGLNIVLPTEQIPNRYITPELCFQFHYFALRKMHMLIRARALVVFPGGFGTLDELFEVLTLIQTRKVQRIPILLFGKSYWKRILNFEALLEECAIDPEDLKLFKFVETAEEAWSMILEFYSEADWQDLKT